MKNLICTLAVLLIAVSVSTGQFKKGDVEAQFAVGFGSYDFKTTTTYSGSNQEHSDTYKHAEFILCPGYYIIDGLSIELELAVSAHEKAQPTQSFLANLSYTYQIPQTQIAPFAHVGYGVSNIYRFPGLMMMDLFSNGESLDTKILNIGGGAKFAFSKHAAIVAELNYRKYTRSETLGALTQDFVFSNIGLLFGVAIIL
jgi:hypothetical protein